MKLKAGQRKRRSEIVRANYKAARERRQRSNDEYRMRLVAEVAATGAQRSARLDMAIDLAVSAHVEVTELSQAFIKCRAGNAAMVRLSSARLALARALRLLGVAPESSSEVPGPSLKDYLAQKEATGGDDHRSNG